MKTVTITPKCNSTNTEELFEFASNTYKVDMQCTHFISPNIKYIKLTEDDFPFYISKSSEPRICTKDGTFIYNKGIFRPYIQELQDDEYYIEEGKCYRIETTLGYFPMFIALKTEIYKNDSPIRVQELVSHQKEKTFPKDTICKFNIANIVEITDLEYTQRKQNILTGNELTKQQLDIVKIKPIPIEKESNWDTDISKIEYNKWYEITYDNGDSSYIFHCCKIINYIPQYDCFINIGKKEVDILKPIKILSDYKFKEISFDEVITICNDLGINLMDKLYSQDFIVKTKHYLQFNEEIAIKQKEITKCVNNVIEPFMGTSKINNSKLIQLDNSKTNELQSFSIKLELDSLNTKPNMDLNPLN